MVIKSIYQQEVLAELIQRINQLTPDTQRKWGTMNAAQMLAHVGEVMEVTLGEKGLKHNLMTHLMGRLIKSVIISDKPFKQGLPTSPEYIVADTREFNTEKERLIALLTKFSKAGEAAAEKRKHPLFGKFTGAEWNKATYKHLDHHLVQFGA